MHVDISRLCASTRRSNSSGSSSTRVTTTATRVNTSSSTSASTREYFLFQFKKSNLISLLPSFDFFRVFRYSFFHLFLSDVDLSSWSSLSAPCSLRILGASVAARAFVKVLTQEFLNSSVRHQFSDLLHYPVGQFSVLVDDFQIPSHPFVEAR